MIESRCGVECSKCEHREAWNCKGCLNMDKPSWGVCEVKKCCESRNLKFCGACKDFPCEMLENMGKDFGYDTSIKIAQCRKWLAEEK